MTKQEAFKLTDDLKGYIITMGHVNSIIQKIYDDFKQQTCSNCKWIKFNGEYENDTCNNTSISTHLPVGTAVADDFGCNRWKKR